MKDVRHLMKPLRELVVLDQWLVFTSFSERNVARDSVGFNDLFDYNPTN